MTEFNIRSDSVDVEEIMRHIRARIREKRGVDYTEDEIRELAQVKLEKFLDPTGVRSDLIEQFRQRRAAATAPLNYAFEDSTLFESHRPLVRWIRRLLRPVLKLFVNPNPLVQALHIQAHLNTRQAQREDLYYEILHNLVVELTRLGIEVKNLKMRVESLSSRLDFDERRARALETVVQYRPGAIPPLPARSGSAAPADSGEEEGAAAERRRRRRRRRRRPTIGAPAAPGGAPAAGTDAPEPDATSAAASEDDGSAETSEP